MSKTLEEIINTRGHEIKSGDYDSQYRKTSKSFGKLCLFSRGNGDQILKDLVENVLKRRGREAVYLALRKSLIITATLNEGDYCKVIFCNGRTVIKAEVVVAKKPILEDTSLLVEHLSDGTVEICFSDIDTICKFTENPDGIRLQLENHLSHLKRLLNVVADYKYLFFGDSECKRRELLAKVSSVFFSRMIDVYARNIIADFSKLTENEFTGGGSNNTTARYKRLAVEGLWPYGVDIYLDNQELTEFRPEIDTLRNKALSHLDLDLLEYDTVNLEALIGKIENHKSIISSVHVVLFDMDYKLEGRADYSAPQLLRCLEKGLR